MTSGQIDDVRRKLQRARVIVNISRGYVQSTIRDDLNSAEQLLDDVLGELLEHSRDAMTQELRRA